MSITSFAKARRAALVVLISSLPYVCVQAQAPAAKPGQAAPVRKPAPKAVPPAKKPAAVAPAVAAAQDVRFKSRYTTGEQVTETVTLVKGERERFEFRDMVLLKQHDLKRTVQISAAAKTYYSTSDTDAAPAAAAPAGPGIVRVETKFTDTGERKTMFGQQARRVTTTIDKQPMTGACDASKQRVETDGWYIDPPKVLEARQDDPSASIAFAESCHDKITATQTGDAKALGFPLAYSTTVVTDNGKPSLVAMEVVEFEVTKLDAAAFDVPAGMTAANGLAEMGKAIGDVNEAKLAAENAAPPAVAIQRAPGAVRIGVAELTNKTEHRVDTRALRAQLAASLTAAKFEAVPLAVAPEDELQKRASTHGLDYLVLADVTELKVTKGGIAGVLRSTTRSAAPPKPGAPPPQDPTEASVTVRLIQPDGRQRLSKTVKGKDGGLNLQAGKDLARFAGGFAVGMMMSPELLGQVYQLNYLLGGNSRGIGLLGNSEFFRIQSMGMAATGYGRSGMDRTVGAATFLVRQSMAMNRAAAARPAGTPSFEGSLVEALDNASKEVEKVLNRK